MLYQLIVYEATKVYALYDINTMEVMEHNTLVEDGPPLKSLFLTINNAMNNPHNRLVKIDGDKTYIDYESDLSIEDEFKECYKRIAEYII